MYCGKEFVVFFLPIYCLFCRSSALMQETVMGVIGAENYTYYSLPQPGSVLVLLHSFQGDADLYISAGNGRPTYDIDNHDLQSTTCGLDYILVPSYFQRPITIGVYGHSWHFSSIYQMEIFIEDSPEEKLPTNSYEIIPSEELDETKISSAQTVLR